MDDVTTDFLDFFFFFFLRSLAEGLGLVYNLLHNPRLSCSVQHDHSQTRALQLDQPQSDDPRFIPILVFKL